MASPLQRLAALLPQEPLLTGVVVATNGTTSTLALIGGGALTVRGTATVGATVYHRGGVIEGEAAAMAGTDIAV